MIVKYFEEISLPKAKKELYFALMQMLSDCLTKDHALGDKFQTQQTAFLTAFERLDAAINASRKSLLTPEIQRLDIQRVQEWRVIRAAVKESLKLPNAATADAANFVLSLINNHGDIENMRVIERTGALVNLCQDLTEKYAAQVAPLGLTGFATQLAATNTLYLQKYEERLHEWSEYIKEEVTNARKVTDDAIENLLIVIASAIILEGMEEYTHFVNYVNEAIKKTKVAMGSPTTKPDGTPPDDGAEEDPDNSEDSDNSEAPDNSGENNDNTGNTTPGGGGGSTLTPDENPPGQNPNPNPGEGNGENEDEYTPPDNDGGFGKAVRRLDV